MVLVTQSNVNEDSQGRQLRVSKKLSKAISSVPRSRFQKPRPNLPGSKRSESNVPPVQKANETTENTVITKTENSNINGSSQKGAVVECATTLNAIDISPNNEIINKSENFSTDETIPSIQKVTEKVITDEISHDTDTVKLTDDITITEKSQSVDELKKSLNTDEATQKNHEVAGNLNELIDETSHGDTTVNSASTNESVEEVSVEKTPTLEVPDSVDVPPITTPNINDKSFKYPHLTSILSKKRAEPKKEVQHKKRKKFKKGDVAPERSKMTMADLIYWNPTSTEPPSKSAVTEYEIPDNPNVDDPEESPEVDTPVEESNICDSVPKLVISEDGSINIDQSSLVISRNIAEPTVTEVIRKDDTTYSSFRKRPMTKHWTAKDTTIFYKALSLVGTDFGLMEKIFPHRTRRELKLKFKREEKFNIDLINRAMYESHLTFDANTLGDLIKNLNDLTGDFSAENGDEDSQPSSKEKKKPVKRKRKVTKVAKPVDSGVSDVLTESVSDDVITNNDNIKTKRKRKTKKLLEDFVDTEEIDEILLSEEETIEMNSNEAACELDSTEISVEGNLHESVDTQLKSTAPKADDMCETTNIEIMCIEDAADTQLKSTAPKADDMCETTNIEIVCIEDATDTQLKSTDPKADDMCETTNIEIVCIEDATEVDFHKGSEGSHTILVPEKTYDKAEVVTIQDSGFEKTTETISLATTDNEQEQCVTVEYVDVNASGDVSLLNNVMAFEVVASNTPIPKRRRKVNFTPKLPKKDIPKNCQPIKLSSTNYTPV